MKTCTPQLADRMLLNPDLVALVGQRVCLFQAVQNAPLPDIVLVDITSSFNLNLAGADSMTIRRIQVTCRAKTYLEADAIGEVVLATMRAIKGPVGDFNVQAAIPVSDTAFFDDTTNISHRNIDFRVHYT
ncbi:hypothetical protein [uncultured Alsobacter sp.]|uniref:tail completion protein gp17 n=1 Tax=uncultured Alsobacter sp. TaxID=1748258 RepID=UPI0025ED1159|nr:hypothetical protein [uncultured Alsobacter sp.]